MKKLDIGYITIHYLSAFGILFVPYSGFASDTLKALAFIGAILLILHASHKIAMHYAKKKEIITQ